MRLRRAGRVIVLDPEDRVLLFRYDDGPPNGRHWCTPGGGLDDGEDYPAGARRELAEETGWTDVPVGPEVYERTRIMEYADAIVRQHERFFLARVETGRRGLGEVAAMHVSDGIAAWHWWTLAELDATDETDLAALRPGRPDQDGLPAEVAGQVLDAVDEAGQQAVGLARGDVRDAGQQFAQHHPELAAGQVGAEAVVPPGPAEPDVRVGRAGDVEALGVRE